MITRYAPPPPKVAASQVSSILAGGPTALAGGPTALAGGPTAFG
ncbi:MAG: hypothetical protein ABSF52_01065 [Syntrophobacteraceae bacterium]|jgi:hypothetical protein